MFRRNNLFTGRTWIDKLETICQTFGITLAEFFNDTDVLVSMTEEKKWLNVFLNSTLQE